MHAAAARRGAGGRRLLGRGPVSQQCAAKPTTPERRRVRNRWCAHRHQHGAQVVHALGAQEGPDVLRWHAGRRCRVCRLLSGKFLGSQPRQAFGAPQRARLLLAYVCARWRRQRRGGCGSAARRGTDRQSRRRLRSRCRRRFRRAPRRPRGPQTAGWPARRRRRPMPPAQQARQSCLPRCCLRWRCARLCSGARASRAGWPPPQPLAATCCQRAEKERTRV